MNLFKKDFFQNALLLIFLAVYVCLRAYVTYVLKGAIQLLLGVHFWCFAHLVAII